MSEFDREVQRIDEGGDAWEETDEVVEFDVKRPLDIVVPVRLSSETWEALHRQAKEVGIGPSTLVRMWLMERLNEGKKTRKAG